MHSESLSLSLCVCGMCMCKIRNNRTMRYHGLKALALYLCKKECLIQIQLAIAAIVILRIHVASLSAAYDSCMKIVEKSEVEGDRTPNSKHHCNRALMHVHVKWSGIQQEKSTHAHAPRKDERKS